VGEQSLPKSEYELLELLDRLESLVEDMDDLSVRTRDEAETLIATIHERLDALERADG
jgi:DNA-binding HxlR family transcriptional regulator